MYVGKTCNSTVFNKDGDIVSNGTNIYSVDGTVTKTNAKVGEAPETRNRKWWMDGSKFCETLYGNDEPWCGAHEVFYRLDDKLYGFDKTGWTKFEIVCQ